MRILNGNFVACIVLSKTIFFLFFSMSDYGFEFLGSDANYYHKFAVNLIEEGSPTNWGIFLHKLNEIGFYSRFSITWLFGFLSIVAIPLIMSMVVVKDIRDSISKKIFAACFVVISLYPSFFLYSTDIYREAAMVFLFSLCLVLVKKITESKDGVVIGVCYFMCIAISGVLYILRPYLGFSMFIALLFFNYYRFSWRIQKWLLVACLLCLQVFYMLGYLNPILSYRDIFFHEFINAGTNLGITFNSWYYFVVDFANSFISQLLGMRFLNALSIVVFIFESLPFLIFLLYVVVNKQYSDKFVDFLVIFFSCYSAIWLLGNDNLGTAIRLRIFNYLSVYVCFFVIYQNKLLRRVSFDGASNESSLCN